MNTNRSTLILTIINLVLLIIVLIQGRAIADQSTPEVLRGRAFELVDSNGQVRAQFDVEKNGEVVLRLRDETGAVRVKLGASEDGSGLTLLNHLTEPGIQILAKDDGTTLTLTEEGGIKQTIEP